MHAAHRAPHQWSTPASQKFVSNALRCARLAVLSNKWKPHPSVCRLCRSSSARSGRSLAPTAALGRSMFARRACRILTTLVTPIFRVQHKFGCKSLPQPCQCASDTLQADIIQLQDLFVSFFLPLQRSHRQPKMLRTFCSNAVDRLPVITERCIWRLAVIKCGSPSADEQNHQHALI